MLELNEKIEAYLTGNLSDAERVTFESSMASDPSLKAEVDMQRDVIDGLKEFRKAQLKARLNNIEVSAGSTQSTVFKYAASFLVATSIGAAVIYFTGSNQTENPTPEVITPEITISEKDQPTITNSESTSDLAMDQAKKDKKKKEANNNSNTTPSNSENKDNSTNTPSNLTKPVDPQFNLPTENYTKVDEFNGSNVDVPNDNISSGAVKSVKGVDKVNYKSQKELSYQYYNNELFLFGDFNSKPYQLIEYNSSKSPRLFIEFEGAIYELKNNTTKQTPMTEITDQALLDQIKKQKNK